MLAAMTRHFPIQVAWQKPEGGLFIWATLPEQFDTARLLDRALKEIKVAFVPGRSFYPDRSIGNTLRLSYSLNTPQVIEAGIARLGELIKATLSDGSCDVGTPLQGNRSTGVEAGNCLMQHGRD